MTLFDSLRTEARLSPASGIQAVSAYGSGRPGIIPLWTGESHLQTPPFITSAAVRALEAGETFYTASAGIPALREALARYHTRHFGMDFSPDAFFVTIGGMQAITLSLQAVAGAGDEVVYLSPAWPNFPAAVGVTGARPVAVLLEEEEAGWTFDLAKMEAAITPRTKAIFVNSPSNPTGWTADIETLRAILDLARKHGLWIIADEIYALFHFGGGRAASFMDFMDPEDRILFVNTFSKNWAMTGWRIGWLKAHPSLAQTFRNLIQYSSSGVAQFLQRGAVTALEEGDAFIKEQVAGAEKTRDRLCDILGATGRVRFSVPAGAFYLFFSIDGMADSRQAAFDLIDHANVGLAPGTAFGPGGEHYLRLCFHRRTDQVEEAAHRIANWIGRN